MSSEVTTKDINETIVSSPSDTEIAKAIQFASEKAIEINQLSLQVVVAQQAAQMAKQKVDDVKKKAEYIKGIAQSTKKVKWYNGKAEAINDLQDVVKGISDAEVELSSSQLLLAEAQQRAVEAQEKMFEFQKRLAEATAMMIAFSITSIVTSRTIVQELEKRLEGASEEELSELARKELILVVSQIKAQQDMMGRQNRLAEILQEQAGINELQNQAIEKEILEGSKREQKIIAHEQKIREHHRIITSQAEMIDGVKEDVQKLKSESNGKIGLMVAIGVSVVALVVSIIQLFI